MLPQIIDHARHGGGVVEKVDMNKRYPTPSRFSEKLTASLPTQSSIERLARSELSVTEFKSRYLPNGIPVVMHSSLSSVANKKLGQQVGVDAYVGKFHPEELAQMVTSMLHPA